LSTFKDDPRGTVSDWVQTTLLRSGVPVAEVAAKVGKSEDLIYKWANRNAEQTIPGPALITLMAVSGDLTILQELAEMFGFWLVPRNGDTLETLRALVKALEKG
jgi:predicted DNA-binding transcriptional regulator AlpA